MLRVQKQSLHKVKSLVFHDLCSKTYRLVLEIVGFAARLRQTLLWQTLRKSVKSIRGDTKN